MSDKLNMECDICGHQWDGDVGPMDQCPACGLLFIGPIGQIEQESQYYQAICEEYNQSVREEEEDEQEAA